MRQLNSLGVSRQAKRNKWVILGVTVAIVGMIIGCISVYNNPVNRVNRLLNLGEKYLSEKEYEQAILIFEAIIAIESKNIDAYLGIADAYEGQGLKEEKLDILKRGYQKTGEEQLFREMELCAQELALAEEKMFEMEKHVDQAEGDLGEGIVNGTADLKTSTNENIVKSVHFERIYEEWNEYAVITGVNDSGFVVWTYQTERYEGADLDRVNDIAQRGDVYYFCEDGIVTALNVADGSILWKNSDFGGCVSGYAFGEKGFLYLCGFYGPDFFAIDKNGKTLGRIDSFDTDYYWAYQIEILGDRAAVTLDGSNYDEGEGAVFYVYLDDFSYSRDFTDGLRVKQNVYEKEVFARMLIVNSSDPSTCTSTLLVDLADGTKIAEIHYVPLEGVGLYGTLEMGDLTGDGQDELLVNIQYFGSTFGAADVYVYQITENGMEEIFQMDSDKISKRFSKYSYGTGATIDNGRLRIHALIGSGWEREYEDILAEYRDGEWRIYEIIS